VTTNGRKQGKREASILLADDDAAMRSLVSDELRDEGYRVVQAADGQAALDCVGKGVPDLIITDFRMPQGGMSLVSRLKTMVPRTPVILMTAFGDKDTESLAYKCGASAYFNKPVRMVDLMDAVHKLLDDGLLPAKSK
jgi:DNA-binding NtrC family response regulator